MFRAIGSVVSFAVALLAGWTVVRLLQGTVLPWRRAPDTTHVTLIFGGMQFTGRGMLVPVAACALLSIAAAIFGVWMACASVRRRDQ